MNWVNIWIKLFGTTEWLGIDMGFWVSMSVVTLLVLIMNVVFWSVKPKQVVEDTEKDHIHQL